MIAPQAFFRPSGTPFSIYNRVTILSELGHDIDIIAYPFGEEVKIKHCRIIRSSRFPFIHDVKPGPSLKKLLLDIPFFFTVRGVAKKKRYDAVFSHEEGALFGRWVRRKQHIPHVYDMHSFIPIMFEEWGISRLKLFYYLGSFFQKLFLRGSDVIVVNCLNLKNAVERLLPGEEKKKKVIVIENTAALRHEQHVSRTAEAVKRQLGLKNEQVILYTGSFVPLQNLDLLLESIPQVVKAVQNVKWVLVGGEQGEIRRLQKKAARLGVTDKVILKERVAPQEIPAYLRIADIVTSPRARGINVPFKLYSLMESGKPILAPHSLLYNSFLDDTNALLTDATPRAFAAATIKLLKDAGLRQKLAKTALEKSRKEYAVESYKRKMEAVCTIVAGMRKR